MTESQKTSLELERILQILVDNKDNLRKLGVLRIGLFGSYRRNDADPDSDIDFLVKLDENSFDRYMDVKIYLEDLFQAPIDLVIEETLKPQLLPYIYKEVRYATGL